MVGTNERRFILLKSDIFFRGAKLNFEEIKIGFKLTFYFSSYLGWRLSSLDILHKTLLQGFSYHRQKLLQSFRSARELLVTFRSVR